MYKLQTKKNFPISQNNAVIYFCIKIYKIKYRVYDCMSSIK